jgi:hypothetical protein
MKGAIWAWRAASSTSRRWRRCGHSDVVGDGVVEEHRVLRNDADLGADAVLGDVADVLAVDLHRPDLMS